MSKKRKLIKFRYLLLTLFFVITLIISGQGFLSVFADSSSVPSVIKDLTADKNFNFSEYPEKADDYSIQVIQIAESKNGKLYLYTYQPCQTTTPLIATEINMSLSNTTDGTILYSLKQVSTWGVFSKYLVEGIKASSEPVRYYNITSIFRDWINGIDSETGNDNEINSKYFPVGKLFTVKTTSDGIKYFCKDTDVVEIINPYVDFVSYYDGLDWASILFMTEKYSDIHYIAFSTDKKIDTLKEADVTYRTQSYTEGRGTSYGDLSDPQYKTLTGEKDISTKNERYTWKSIMTSSDFIKSTELNDTTKKEVANSEFVLVFLSTPYSQRSAGDMVGHYTIKNGTKVSRVSILRLKFETDGDVYNLGALMDMQEGDNIAGNKSENENIGFWAYIWRCIVRLFNGTATLTEQIVAVAAIFICVMFLPILLTILSFVFPAFGAVVLRLLKGLWTGIKYLLIGLWYVISSPVRLIIWIVHKKRGE